MIFDQIYLGKKRKNISKFFVAKTKKSVAFFRSFEESAGKWFLKEPFETIVENGEFKNYLEVGTIFVDGLLSDFSRENGNQQKSYNAMSIV